MVDTRGSNSSRNLLFDGTDLTFDGFESPTGTVLEPSTVAFVAGFLGFESVVRRRR